MAEPLKNRYGPEVPKRIAAMIRQVHRRFPHDRFLSWVLEDYNSLELMPRGWKIAHALNRFLPRDYEKAIDIILASLNADAEEAPASHALSAFLYMPHTFYVARYGLEHFEASMRAQYELTQRFTAEFSIRPYLEKHTKATLKRLRRWTGDDNVHVRRLVSEGTRPRLPWATRLREFQRDPAPVLELLEHLKDDPELYVRRSVANNLNDIGKDHPKLLFRTARAWSRQASEERKWIVRHALRTAIKRAEPEALAVIGYANAAAVSISGKRLSPARAKIGESVTLSFSLTSTASRKQNLLVDFRIHYRKANGTSSAKVFKLKELTLAPKETVRLSRKVSLAQMTTRTHYPGKHRVDVVINGRSFPLGAFAVLE
jgi:3-methyladenine DNA glycosylase AlkC